MEYCVCRTALFEILDIMFALFFCKTFDIKKIKFHYRCLMKFTLVERRIKIGASDRIILLIVESTSRWFLLFFCFVLFNVRIEMGIVFQQSFLPSKSRKKSRSRNITQVLMWKIREVRIFDGLFSNITTLERSLFICDYVTCKVIVKTNSVDIAFQSKLERRKKIETCVRKRNKQEWNLSLELPVWVKTLWRVSFFFQSNVYNCCQNQWIWRIERLSTGNG